MCRRLRSILFCRPFRIIMRCIKQIYFSVLKQCSKLTLTKIVWILTVIISYIVIVNWKYIDNETVVDSIESQLKSEQDVNISKRFVDDSINPIIVWWTRGFRDMRENINCQDNLPCDVYDSKYKLREDMDGAYLFYASTIDFNDLPLPRRPANVIWGLSHEESPRNVQELMHENILNLFNYSSTFSRYSDVPFPLQHLGSLETVTSQKYFLKTTEKNTLLKDIAPIIYLQSDCSTSTERDKYVEELAKHIKIDSYGACVNNKKLPTHLTEDYLNNLNDDSFLRFVARYKFTIAIENGVCNDYITEKLWRAIRVGSVPIYFGSPTVTDWLPNNKSAILLEDYRTPKALSEHLKMLNSNDNVYDEYLEHKTRGIIENERLINELRTRPYQTYVEKTGNRFECFICEKLHDKLKAKDLKQETRRVTKKHYDCPKPISALTLEVNPSNVWVHFWESTRIMSERLLRKIETS